MVDTDRIDEARLTAIKGTRAMADPIIVDGRSRTTDIGPADHIEDAITQERMANAMEVPTTEPIRKVGWAETSLLFSSLTLVEKPPRDVREMYEWAFHKLTAEVLGMDKHERPGFAVDPDPLTDRLQHKLEDTRKSIKVARDKHYLEHHYDSENSVPKAFWTEWHPGPASRSNFDPVDYVVATTDQAGDTDEAIASEATEAGGQTDD